jgi:hypothetical protein
MLADKPTATVATAHPAVAKQAAIAEQAIDEDLEF